MASRNRPPPLDLSPQTPKDEFAFHIDLQGSRRSNSLQEFATLSPSYLLADTRFNLNKPSAIAQPPAPPTVNSLFNTAEASSQNHSRFSHTQGLASQDFAAPQLSSSLPSVFPTPDLRYSNQPPRRYIEQERQPFTQVSRHDFDSPATSTNPPGLDFSPNTSAPFEEAQYAQKSSCTLWLGDLEVWMSEEYIKSCVKLMGWDLDASSPTGRVDVIVKLAKNGRQANSHYCFLYYPTPAQAVAIMNHYEAQQRRTLMPGSGRTFKLNYATGSPGMQPSWENEYSLFAGDLDKSVTEIELLALFTPSFPSCSAAKIMCDAQGVSKGYGFVRFSSPECRERALYLGRSSPSSFVLRGRRVRINEASVTGKAASPVIGRFPRAIPSNASPIASGSDSAFSNALDSLDRGRTGRPLGNDPYNTTVFVGGLPEAITEDMLKSLFMEFGEVNYVKVPPGKGCGFVHFIRREDAERAMIQLNDYPVHGHRIRLSWGRSPLDKHAAQVSRLSAAMSQATEQQWDNRQGKAGARARGNSSPVNPTHFSPNVPPSSLQLQSQGPTSVQSAYGFTSRDLAPFKQPNSLGLDLSFGNLSLDNHNPTTSQLQQGPPQNLADRFADQEPLHRRRHHSNGYSPLSISGFTSPTFMRSGSSLTPDGTRYVPRLSSPLSSDVTPTASKRRSYF